MNKKLKTYLIVTLIFWTAYLIIWLGVMFIHMEYYHPFEYLFNITEVSSSKRSGMLSAYALTLAFKWIAIASINDYKKQKQ